MVKYVGFALIATLALTGCGKRSDLVKPSADVSQPANASGQPAPAKKDTFILDPLVQ